MNPPIFLFGTLCHAPLLTEIIGDSSHLVCEPAQLEGFRVRAVAGGLFPVILADDEAVTDGLLVSGLTATNLAVLEYYETVFEYSLQPVVISDGRAARAYMPPDGRFVGAQDWVLSDWVHTWGDISLRAAREVISYRGRKSPAEVAAMFSSIRARAASEINAQKSRHGAHTLSGTVVVHERHRPYSNFFAVDEYTLQHSLFDGSKSIPLERAVWRAPDAALVLPYDPQRDRVLLVEQFRMGPLARGDRSLWQLEPIAGRMDAGEAAETCVRREALEEAALSLGALHPVAEVYCSPGNSSEFYYMFVGEADLPDAPQHIGGLESEGEDIRTHLISFDTLMDMCDRFEVSNAPLLTLALWLARHRERLRRSFRA